MNKQLLTIGIVLSLGTVGCAGFGVQHGSSLTAQVQNEQGVDTLWIASEKGPTQGLEAPAYADQGLGPLWNTHEDAENSAGAIGSYAHRSLGNLWNSAL